MKQTKNIIVIFLVSLTLIIAIFSNVTSVNALPSVDIDELDGNILNNPHIRYTEQDNLIPHWNMVVTNNIFGGSSVVTGLKETVNGRRATKELTGFELSSSNQSNEFTSYISGGKEADGFFLLGQTYSNITRNKTYIFRTEIRGNARVVMNIYPGKAVSGTGVIHTREIQASNEVQVLEIEFRTELTEITLSFRHMAGSANETFVNIRGAAFIDKESYIKQQFVKSITEYINNEEDFIMDSTIESLINDGAKNLTDQSTNEEIELQYIQTLEDVHYYLMINNLKNYNDTFNTKITFDENLFVHLKDGLTVQNYRERLAIAREINLNLYKNKLNTVLLSYSESLDENFSQNEKLIAIIDEHINQLNENPNYDDIYNEAIIKIDNEYLLYNERIRINNELDELFSTYLSDLYTAENYQKLEKIIDDAKNEVDNNSNLEELKNYNLEEVSKLLNSIKTKLDEAKDQLRDEILDNYPDEDYSEENYQEIKDKIDEFLDGLTDIDEVENFELEGSTLKDELDDIKTKLDEAKDQLRDEILDNYPEEDYSEENYQEIKDKIDEFLDGLTDIDEVENFELEGSTLKDELDDIKNLEEELADLKEEAKKDLDDFIKDLVDENTTKEELDEILKEFEDKINNAKDKEELDHILDDVKKELENQKEINDKNKDLDDFVDAAEDSYKYGDLGQKLIDDILKELEKSLSEKLTREEILDLIIEALEKLRAVKIYNLSSVEGITPNGNYNSQEILDDLYAYIESTEGVKSSVNLKASVKDLINEQTIREMIRKGLIIPKNSQDLNQLIKTLNKQSIFGLIDISLYDDEVKYTEYNGVYTVSLLLPRKLRTLTNLSVLYKGIEKVEVFEVETNGDWITFKTDHFSEFYLIGDSIVGEQTVNLWWLIITLLIIITLEIVVIVILKVKNKSTKAYSVSFLPLLAVLPINAITWIIILSIIIILLAIYIIYLILQTNQKVKVFEQKEEVEIVNKEAETPKVLIQERNEPLYNYSFTSRLHMADEAAMDRFNELKNYVLSYEGVTVSTTWRQETYLFKNKSVFKVRINGKTLNVYFNLNLDDFKDTKYIFIDRSDVKAHQSTPLQYVIKGPRKLNWAKELIDYYMKENGGNKKDKYTYVNYKVEPLTRNTLIRRGLIKVTGATKEYQDMISGSK